MRRVLVVDDSATMRLFVASVIEELEPPVEVRHASSGFEALRCLPRDHFDLVITDVNMPDLNGLELISYVKSTEALRGLRLVVVSSEGSQADCDRARALGADAYLVKPFDPDKLRTVVEQLLGEAGQDDA